jgi:cytochrome c5
MEDVMKKGLKWVGIVLGGLAGLLVMAVGVLYVLGSAQLNKTWDIQAEAIAVPTNDAALARGEQLVDVALCRVCHGQDLSGDIEFEDPAVGTVYSSNITGLGETHSDADLVLAIRHGVDTDGRQLLLMPSNIYLNLSAEDLGAMIAYLTTIPPAGDDLPESRITFMGRVFLGAGMFGDVFAAETIDHNQPYPTMPEIGANIAYGEYLAPLCTNCHGEGLSGQLVDPSEAGSPWAPNLTSGGELGEWSAADFINTMRTGVSPDNHALDPEWMPWEAFGKLAEDELRGLWLYLQSLPTPGG